MGPVVLKVGGEVLDSPSGRQALWQGIRRWRDRAPLLLVHGGGAQATALARALGHEPRFVEGRRLTTELDLRIVLWTLCGELNRRLVAEALTYGLPAVGLCGADGGMVRVVRRPPRWIEGRWVDFGYVGDIRAVKPELLRTLLEQAYLPIVAPLGIDEQGAIYNVNADTVALELALALRAEALLWLTPSGGVWDASGRTLETLSVEDARRGLQEGWIRDGMRPKIETALRASARGVRVLRRPSIR